MFQVRLIITNIFGHVIGSEYHLEQDIKPNSTQTPRNDGHLTKFEKADKLVR